MIIRKEWLDDKICDHEETSDTEGTYRQWIAKVWDEINVEEDISCLDDMTQEEFDKIIEEAEWLDGK